MRVEEIPLSVQAQFYCPLERYYLLILLTSFDSKCHAQRIIDNREALNREQRRVLLYEKDDKCYRGKALLHNSHSYYVLCMCAIFVRTSFRCCSDASVPQNIFGHELGMTIGMWYKLHDTEEAIPSISFHRHIKIQGIRLKRPCP